LILGLRWGVSYAGYGWIVSLDWSAVKPKTARGSAAGDEANPDHRHPQEEPPVLLPEFIVLFAAASVE
jgi:hypothetical protein